MSETDLIVADEFYDVFMAPMKRVYLDEDFNCRGHITPESVNSLAKSIEEEKLKAPIVLQPMSDLENPVEGFDYRVVAGHRRFKAFQKLGRDRIPSFIRFGEDARKVYFENFIENAERENLTMIAEARWLRATYTGKVHYGRISNEIGKDPTWVRTRFLMLELPDWILERVEKKDLGPADVQAIVASPDPSGRAQHILKAKKEGTYRTLMKRRPKKIDIQRLMKDMLQEGFGVELVRIFGWTIGEIPDEELEESLKWLRTKKAWLRG